MAPSIGIMSALSAFVVAPLLLSPVSAHIALWHPSMYGFNVTDKTFPYDNRPVVPLADMTFDQWWFHGHIGYPPHKEDVFELPVGTTVTAELACDKGATSYYTSSQGGDVRQGDWPCPNSPSTQFHTINETDTKGCALAIARVPNVNDVKPEDFVVFSINQKCVWNRFTKFDVPADMPACPEGGCHCAWFWIHDFNSGSEQNYMNGFQCNVTGARPDAPAIGKPQLPRRCGADPEHGVPNATPSNCTIGPKSPFYWFQKEGNNMFEGTYAPPYYNDLYHFQQGAQNDIFETSGTSNSSTSTSSTSSTSTSTTASPTPTPNSVNDSGSPQAGGDTTPTASTSTSTPPSLEQTATTTKATATPPAGCRQRPSSNGKHAISGHARRSRARGFGHT